MQKSPFVMVIVGILSLIAIIAGIAKMTRGVMQIAGSGTDGQYKQLLKDSDQAIDDANKVVASNQEKFSELLELVDSIGLAAVRRDKQELAKQVKETFASIEVGYKRSSAKLDEAIALRKENNLVAYLKGKSTCYQLYADAFNKNQEMVELVMDESTTELEDFLKKLTVLAQQRDALQKQAKDQETEADALAKKL